MGLFMNNKTNRQKCYCSNLMHNGQSIIQGKIYEVPIIYHFHYHNKIRPTISVSSANSLVHFKATLSSFGCSKVWTKKVLSDFQTFKLLFKINPAVFFIPEN
ncbi:hypothetical protein Glove_396g72 [Diversispora epigaea]|uniref:Uncharacterized protein n=1 Tax=Diversispora epigaea TaxID=1348612 RepID=A0A397H5C3_9GLOM|nr:hypothetical protein Glove_396g72 [Diversispora epigaea]